MTVRTYGSWWPVAALTLTVAACTPAVESLHPVTLQPGARQPSEVPPIEKPVPLDFSDSEEGEEADNAGSAEAETTLGLPPKRRVVSGDTPAEEDPTLAEIARRERARREAAAPPIASIDDENIERSSPESEVVVAQEQAAPATGPTATLPGSEGADEAQRQEGSEVEAEEYWRQRVRDLRYQWIDLVSREERLKSEVNGLRRDYYQEDDGYYRDAEIKPEWDQAWEDLQHTRQEILATIDELDRTIEEGRRAGALPGWLRDGVELEPERPSAEERRRLGTTDPVEPTEVNEAAEIDS